MIRKAAGLGVANLSATPHYQDKQYLFCDVAVVGAGPAGLSAALKAAEGGSSVLLVDEQPELGGSLTYHRSPSITAVQSEAKTLIANVTSHPRIRVLTMRFVMAVYRSLPARDSGRSPFKVRAKSCVLATGR